jgi:hypothetical protein
MSFFSHLLSSSSFIIVCSDVHVKDESCQKLANNMESSDPAVSVAEGNNDLYANLDMLDIDPKISENNQER